MRNVHDLVTLIKSQHSVVVMETDDEESALSLAQSASFQTKLQLYEWSVTTGLTSSHFVNLDKVPMVPIALLEKLGDSKEEAIYLLKDFAVHLDNALMVRKFREVAQKFSKTRSTIILTGTDLHLPPELRQNVVFFQIELPSQAELDTFVRALYEQLSKAHKISVELTKEQYSELLKSLSGMTLSQVRNVLSFVMVDRGKLTSADIQTIFKKKSDLLKNTGLLEFYPLVEDEFSLGGFGGLKKWLDVAQVGFSENARKLNLDPPKGIMITGIQGCGKSLAAKFIAKHWGMPLLKLDSSRLFDKFIGETEKNFTKATFLAENMAPCVLWIDEIEKGVSLEDGAGDGGLSKRLFGSFLTWLQEKKKPVFVVATANDLMKLPAELMRKGRFDEIFFVDLPDRDERINIFEIHIRQRNVDPDKMDIPRLADAAVGFSGAEIEQAIVSSLYNSLYEKRQPTAEFFIQRLKNTVPLSIARQEDLAKLRQIAKGRFVSVR